METQAQSLMLVLEETEHKSLIEMILDHSNTVANAALVSEVMDLTVAKFSARQSLKDKKTADRKRQQEEKFFAKLRREEKDRLNRIARCAARQARLKMQFERWNLASRNVGGSGSGVIRSDYVPPPIPLCKLCGKHHW